MAKNQIKAGAILSYMQIGLSIVIGLLYTPIMLRILGKSDYGLYTTVSSTISMLSILSLGFGSAYIRFYSKYKAEDDKVGIAKLNGLFITVFAVVAAVAFACGLFLAFNLELVFDKGLTAAEYQSAQIMMIMLSFNLAMTFLTSVFQNIISANEEFVFQKLVSMIKTVVSPFVTLPVLLMGFGSVGMVAATVTVTLIADIINVSFCFKKLHVKFAFSKWEKGLFAGIAAYTSFIAINLLVDQINWNIGKVLLGRFRGTASVAVYSIGYTLYQYYMMFSTSVANVFTPRVHTIENSNEPLKVKNEKLTALMIQVGRMQYLILALILLGLVFFGRPFIGFWAGEGYENSYIVCLLLAVSGTIPLIQNVGIEIQRAKNKHRFRSYVYIGMALANLIISVVLCQIWGEIGAAVGTAVSLVVANGIIINIYYQHLQINVISFWKNILRLSVGLIFPIICGILLNIFCPVVGIWDMLWQIPVFAVIYLCSMWRLGMNTSEKNMVQSLIKRVTHKNA